MMINGMSTPVVVALILLVVVVLIYFVPIVLRKKSLVNYSKFNWKECNSFFTYGGVGGIGFAGLKLSKEPVVHQGGKADIWLEGIENPLTNVNINRLDPECNYKTKDNATSIFSDRVEVYLNVDANGETHPWDNMFVQDWSIYADNFKKNAKAKVLASDLEDKEMEDELKGISQSGMGSDSSNSIFKEVS